MVNDFLIIGGVNTADYDIHVSREDTYPIPERDVTMIEVPGRNGDLIQDNGRWKNVDIPFHMFCFDKEKYNAFMRKIANMRGYVEIVDSERPGEYRLGVLSASVQPVVTGVKNKNFSWDLVFNCKPQRFKKKIVEVHDLADNLTHYIERDYDFNKKVENSECVIEISNIKDSYLDVWIYNPDGTSISINFTISLFDTSDDYKIIYDPIKRSYSFSSSNKDSYIYNGSIHFIFSDGHINYFGDEMYIQAGAEFEAGIASRCKIRIEESRFEI